MSNDAKALATLGAIALFLLVMLFGTMAGPSVWPSIVTGLFTLASVVGAALIATYQLRRQSENAQASNRQTEALRLKKEIYEEVWRKTDQARATLDALSVHLSDIERDAVRHLENEAEMPGKHLQRDEFEERVAKVKEACLELSRLAEAWTVADGRLRLFAVAFVKLYECGTEIEREYRNATASPGEFADFVGAMMAIAPSEPQGQPLIDLLDMIERWFDVIDLWKSLIDDYQRAMQQVLLSELFSLHLEQTKYKLGERRALRRIRLEDFDELIDAFEENGIQDDLSQAYRTRRENRRAQAERRRASLSTPNG